MRLSQAIQASVPRQTLLSSPAQLPCPQNKVPGRLPGPAPSSYTPPLPSPFFSHTCLCPPQAP